MRYFFLFSLLIPYLPSRLPAQSPTEVQAGIQSYQSADYESCIIHMARLIEADSLLPPSTQAIAHFYLAQSYLALSDQVNMQEAYPYAVIESYNHLLAARDLDPTAYQAPSRSGSAVLWTKFLQEIRTAIQNADWDRTAKFVDRAVLIRRNDPEVNYYRGLSLNQRGLTERARQSWQIARSKAETGSEVWVKTSLQIARSLSEGKNHEAALTYLPEESLIPAIVQERFKVLGKVPNGNQQANAYFQQLRQKAPGKAFPQYGLALFYAESGKIEDAINSASSNLRLFPDDKASHALLASIFLAQARDWVENDQVNSQIEASLRKAAAHLEYLYQQEPDNDRWRAHLYNVYQWLNLPDQNLYKPVKK